MELLVGMYGELIATLTLVLAALPIFKKCQLSTKTYILTFAANNESGENLTVGARI